MQNAVRSTTAQSLVENVMQLVSLPEIYLRLQRVIDDPLHSREQFAGIIAYDTSLSARVLRIANSSYYGFPRRIETVAEAVGIVGELDIRNLVLATTVVDSMSTLSRQGVDIGAFWMHSLRCGVIARQLALKTGVFKPDVMFLAGILHDIGILVIYQQDAALAGAVARQVDEKHQFRDQAERELLGFDHAEVGALLIEGWGLSAELAELARCHHQYQLAQQNREASLMLALANRLAGDAPAENADSDPMTASMIEQLAIGSDLLALIVEQSEQQCAEIKNIILG